MYWLEHDAKDLLSRHGIAVPQGTLLSLDEALDEKRLPPGPWMVKGQIAAGGRGKAGIIRKASTPDEIKRLSAGILGTTIKARHVASVRIEQQITGAAEAYIGFLVDAARGGVRVIVSERGGVDIESLPHDAIRSDTVAPEREAILACVNRLVDGMAPHKASALREAAANLASLLLKCEAVLIEINPLFVRSDGSWVAGDAKIVTDDNALERQPSLREVVTKRAAAYPEVALKLDTVSTMSWWIPKAKSACSPRAPGSR